MPGFAMLMLLGAQAQDHPLMRGPEDGFDLAQIKPGMECGADGEAIVVCGRADAAERFRLRARPELYVEEPVRAETDFAGGKLSAEVEQRNLPGARAPAAMIRFRLPLGKRTSK